MNGILLSSSSSSIRPHRRVGPHRHFGLGSIAAGEYSIGVGSVEKTTEREGSKNVGRLVGVVAAAANAISSANETANASTSANAIGDAGESENATLNDHEEGVAVPSEETRRQ